MRRLASKLTPSSYIVTLQVKEQLVPFRLDTGADVSLIDEATWEDLGSHGFRNQKIAFGMLPEIP